MSNHYPEGGSRAATRKFAIEEAVQEIRTYQHENQRPEVIELCLNLLAKRWGEKAKAEALEFLKGEINHGNERINGSGSPEPKQDKTAPPKSRGDSVIERPSGRATLSLLHRSTIRVRNARYAGRAYYRRQLLENRRKVKAIGQAPPRMNCSDVLAQCNKILRQYEYMMVHNDIVGTNQIIKERLNGAKEIIDLVRAHHAWKEYQKSRYRVDRFL